MAAEAFLRDGLLGKSMSREQYQTGKIEAEAEIRAILGGIDLLPLSIPQQQQ